MIAPTKRSHLREAVSTADCGVAFRDVVGPSPTKQQMNGNRDGRPMTAPTEKYLFTIIYIATSPQGEA